MDDFSWSMNRPVGHLINLFCQAMAEGARVGPDGVFDLDLQAIRHPAVRQAQLATLKVNAEAVARLALRPGTREQGDPDNRLIQIGFDRYPGGDAHARQDRMLSSLFGWEDSVAMVRHDAALTAASRKARAQLPALREAFRQGLRPGEFIQVKAPFATPDGGNEWMWVEVTRWTGEAIEGLLKNEPVRIPGLHGGQIVTVRQPQVFDYIRRFPDGTEEGNGTAEIIRKMQGQTGK